MANLEKLKQIIQGKHAELTHAQDGHVWYKILYSDVHKGSVTPREYVVGVPFEDIKGGRFNRDEKASVLMHWIRKQLDEEES